MFTVTDEALAHLSELLTKAEASEDVAVRFLREGRGLVLQLDKTGEGDTIFEHEGKTVLVFDEEVSEVLTDSTLGVEESEAGARLALT